MRREPDTAFAHAQERLDAQQDQATLLRERMARVDAKIAEMDRRIANLDEDIELETDRERRAEYRLKRADRIRTRGELEAERKDLLWRLVDVIPPPAELHAWYLGELAAAIPVETEPATPEHRRAT